MHFPQLSKIGPPGHGRKRQKRVSGGNCHSPEKPTKNGVDYLSTFGPSDTGRKRAQKRSLNPRTPLRELPRRLAEHMLALFGRLLQHCGTCESLAMRMQRFVLSFAGQPNTQDAPAGRTGAPAERDESAPAMIFHTRNSRQLVAANRTPELWGQQHQPKTKVALQIDVGLRRRTFNLLGFRLLPV